MTREIWNGTKLSNERCSKNHLIKFFDEMILIFFVTVGVLPKLII